MKTDIASVQNRPSHFSTAPHVPYGPNASMSQIETPSDTLHKQPARPAVPAIDPYAPLMPMPAHLRKPAVGVPRGQTGVTGGRFYANGCCVWNPTMWPVVAVCFGSWVLSLPSQSSR